MHWPVDGSNALEYKATYAAMTLLVDQDKVRNIGISNFSPHQLKDLLNSTSHPPAVHQMELHPYLQQNDWINWHAEHSIHVTGYSPFAGSNPTYSPGEPPQLLQNKVVTKIAKKRECTPAQVVLVWGMSRGTSVIPKSSHADRIVENFGALRCELKKHDIKKLNDLGEYHHRFNNPSKSWGVDLYHGLEDSEGKHKKSH
jgi:alcohol dehydrogenase (NADP+)